MQVTFWNIEGYNKNLFKLDKVQQEILTNFHIICISETWLLTEPSIPIWLKSYKWVHSVAKRLGEEVGGKEGS